MRLLLADDNPINQKVGLSVLQKLGYRADVASNGLEVLQALEQKAYDIIFLDVQMPEMDGLEAARQICQRWPAGKAPAHHRHDRQRASWATAKNASKPAWTITSPSPSASANCRPPWSAGASKIVKKSDTSFFARQGITGTLLDQTLISELRGMPPAGGATMLKELIELFLEHAPGRISQINQFLNDPQKLAFHAHALKSMSLNLGANRIAQLCQKLEEMAHSGNEESIARLAQELDRTFRLTQAELVSLQESEK